MADTTGRWGFAEPGPLRDRLTELALAGTKTTTASLAIEYEIEGAELAEVGQRDLLVDTKDRPVAIVETVSLRVMRLADIDGSGTADLIYLHRDGPRLYFNQSGNGWSQAPIVIPGTPPGTRPYAAGGPVSPGRSRSGGAGR